MLESLRVIVKKIKGTVMMLKAALVAFCGLVLELRQRTLNKAVFALFGAMLTKEVVVPGDQEVAAI
jgi:hypothetical protein